MQTQFISFVASISLLTAAQAQVSSIDLNEQDSNILYDALTLVTRETTWSKETCPNGQIKNVANHTKSVITHDNMLNIFCSTEQHESYFTNYKCTVNFEPSPIDTTNILDESFLSEKYITASLKDPLDIKSFNQNQINFAVPFIFTSSEKVKLTHNGSTVSTPRFYFFCELDDKFNPDFCRASGIITQ